jgi:hypothetical protein
MCNTVTLNLFFATVIAYQVVKVKTADILRDLNLN